MELRHQTNIKLINMLKDAGVYEDGMEEEEMRQLAEAMQMSIIESCQQQESELEFLSLQSAELLSSTLIVATQMPPTHTLVDGWNSPPPEPIYLTVGALVHHAMDWSPSKDPGPIRTRKRSSAGNPPLSEHRAAKRSMLSEREEPQEGDQQQQGEQPYDPDATPVSPNPNDVGDSGISWDEISISSISDANSMPSIGDMPSGHMVSTSSVAVSEPSSDSHQEDSRDQIDDNIIFLREMH